MDKNNFIKHFKDFALNLEDYVSDAKRDWKIKGFIDTNKNIFTISTDTKIVSKIIEIHIFPKIVLFAKKIGFNLKLAEFQNYYPDLTFVYKKDPRIKYAVDIKTTFRRNTTKEYCSFTLGSHGEYFTNRNSTKNIQFPYNQYKGHFVLGVIYTRNENIDETKIYSINQLEDITSVINDLQFFFIEKWKIANEKSGSGNTANIGGILFKEQDMVNGNGIFPDEETFDDYWMNYGKITLKDKQGNTKRITKLSDFLKYRGKK